MSSDPVPICGPHRGRAGEFTGKLEHQGRRTTEHGDRNQCGAEKPECKGEPGSPVLAGWAARGFVLSLLDFAAGIFAAN